MMKTILVKQGGGRADVYKRQPYTSLTAWWTFSKSTLNACVVSIEVSVSLLQLPVFPQQAVMLTAVKNSAIA